MDFLLFVWYLTKLNPDYQKMFLTVTLLMMIVIRDRAVTKIMAKIMFVTIVLQTISPKIVHFLAK